MTDDTGSTERSFLRRWSQRKLAASREATAAGADLPVDAKPTAEPREAVASAPSMESSEPSDTPRGPLDLPPVDSLTLESDFTAYLKPSVDPGLKRAALRKLFSDPHFNVMDGLDVYIDDYNKFEPLPPDLVKQLAHAKYLFDPPKTRVNAEGCVEDVRDEPDRVASVDAVERDEQRGTPVESGEAAELSAAATARSDALPPPDATAALPPGSPADESTVPAGAPVEPVPAGPRTDPR